MMYRCIALVLALLLMPFAATGAQETGTVPETAAAQSPADSNEVALRLLDAVFATDDIQEQIRLILEAAEAAPDSVDILVSAAQLLYYLDEKDEYRDTCEKLLQDALAIAEGEDLLYTLQAYAEQLVYWERSDEALALIESHLEDNPAQEQLMTTYATVLYYAGEGDKAVEVLEEVLEDSPRNLDARRLHAAILLDECRYEEALAVYKQMESEWPEYLDGTYGQYLTYKASGQFDLAIRTIDVLLNYGGDNALWLERARIRLWNLCQPEQAMKEAEALMRADDQMLDAATVKLVSLLMLEDYDAAHEVATEMGKVDQEYAGLLDAIILMNENRWPAAQKSLNVITGTDRGAYMAWKNLSNVWLAGYDDVDNAMEAMQTAFSITEGEGDMDLFMQLGHVYRRQGRLLEAARSFSAADMTTYEDPTALYYLVLTCIDAGRAGDAQDILDEMVRRYPGWHETMLAEVFVEDALGHAKEALEAFYLFEERFPFPVSQMPYTEAVLLAAAGDEAALDIVKQLVAEEDADANDWDIYAYVLLLLGDLEGAQEALAESRSRNPVPEADGAGTGDLHNLQISQLTTEAELALAQGDLAASIEAFSKAADLGWPVYSLGLHPEYEKLRTAEGYEELMSKQEPMEPEWDLSVLPVIPTAK